MTTPRPVPASRPEERLERDLLGECEARLRSATRRYEDAEHNMLLLNDEVQRLQALAAADTPPDSAPPTADDGPTAWDRGELDIFSRIAARQMRQRLDDGARKFGALSWRHETYTDADNIARLRRAVDHLIAVLARWRNPDTNTVADPGEMLKRAADVANQAFMLADLLRREGNDQSTYATAALQSQPDRERLDGDERIAAIPWNPTGYPDDPEFAVSEYRDAVLAALERDGRLDVERLAAVLPRAVNFRFLPPRVVDDPTWREIATDIAAAYASPASQDQEGSTR